MRDMTASLGSQGAFVAKAAGAAFVGIVGICTLFGGYYRVGENDRAVVTINGAFSHVAGPGGHLKVPFLSDAEDFFIGNRTTVLAKMETFTTGDQPQHVDMDWVVQWFVPAANVERVFRLGRDVEPMLKSMIADRAKIEVGRRHANAIPAERGDITRAVLASVRAEALRLYGVEITDMQMPNFDYSPAFRAAVDAAAVASQKQAQIRTEADTAEARARGEAQSSIQEARGKAESSLLAARAAAQATELRAAAEANAIRLKGEAEAGAIQAQAAALGASPNYVALRQAERWNGTLPTQVLGSAPMPFLNVAPNR